MNSIIKIMTVSCFMTTLALNGITPSPLSTDDDVTRLQKENAQLRNREQGRAVADLFEAYWASLKRRWELPENEEDYNKRLAAEKVRGDMLGNYEQHVRVQKAGYKKSMWDRHPFKGDVVFFTTIAAASIGLGIYLSN